MTKEDRELLLRDLCSRLPYGVHCMVQGYKIPKRLNRIEIDPVDGTLLDFILDEETTALPLQVYLSEVKPVLRPMQTMTREEFHAVTEYISQESHYAGLSPNDRWAKMYSLTLEWLGKHKFDYNNLIPKELAYDERTIWKSRP